MTRKNTDGWAGLVDVDEGGVKRPSNTAPAPVAQPVAKPVETSGSSLKLPKPAGAAAPAPRPPPAAPPSTGFSDRDLIEKLELQKPKVETKGSIWSEYRELILTGLAGLLILAGVLVYRSMPDEGETPKPAATTVAPPVVAPKKEAPPPPPAPPIEQPAAPVAENVAPVEEKPSAPARAAVPMLSVITTPPGASVEVNGLIRGKSPLIMPSPSVDPTVQVRVTMNGFKNYEENVSAGEGGHYVLRIDLEPVR